MPVQTRKNKRRSLPKAGGSAQHKQIRKRQAGDKPRKASSITPGGFGLHLLGSKLESRSLFELAIMSGFEVKKSKGILASIDTEEKQLQAIHDLYEIMRAQPKYKAMKEKDWHPETTPITIILWLLRKLGALADGEQWMIDTYKEKGKTRFRFVVCRYYSNYYVKGDSQFMCMNFLPYLLKKDKPLHDLIIDIVALVSKCNKVPLWDEDGDYSVILAKHIKDRTASKFESMQTYVSGPAFQYLRHIKARRRKVTYDLVENAVKAYNNNSQRKQILTWWIRNGLNLTTKKKDISQSTFIPNYETRSVLTPYQSYKFIWSDFDRDPLEKGFDKFYSKYEKRYPPLEFSIVYPGEVYKPVQKDKFPILLDDFMRSGINYFKGTFHDYFYKKMLKELSDGETTTLLETFLLKDLL